MNLKLITLLACLVALSGCQGDERLKEVATKEAQAQLAAAKQALETRSNDMEEDLSVRQRFYQGVAGTYEGEAIGATGTFMIRIRLVSSISPYSANRIRLPEEVAADLNNLFLSAQIIQWNVNSKGRAVGCRVANIRPDLTSGKIQIASPDCPNFYAIQISEDASRRAPAPQDESQRAAQNLLGGKLPHIPALIGEIQPTTSSDLLMFNAVRVNK